MTTKGGCGKLRECVTCERYRPKLSKTNHVPAEICSHGIPPQMKSNMRVSTRKQMLRHAGTDDGCLQTHGITSSAFFVSLKFSRSSNISGKRV